MSFSIYFYLFIFTFNQILPVKISQKSPLENYCGKLMYLVLVFYFWGVLETKKQQLILAFFFPLLFCKLLPNGNQKKMAATHRKGVFGPKKKKKRPTKSCNILRGGRKNG
jgi:hypothetical protein